MASISDRVGDVGGYLREQRENARLSVRQLATLAGVSNPYLSQVERGLRKPSAEVLQQIAKGLRISAEVLYVRAGILDHEGRPDVEAAVAADPYLNDRQRRVLLDIYASFRAENAREAALAEISPVVPVVRKAAAKKAAAKKAAATTAATTKAVATKAAAKRTAKKAAKQAAVEQESSVAPRRRRRAAATTESTQSAQSTQQSQSPESAAPQSAVEE